MITAKIIADSISSHGNRLTTFELEYPRFVHSELMTHRLLSKNAASSRAIPFKANVENIINNTAMPVHWGLNQAGMVADKEASTEIIDKAIEVWLRARDSAINFAAELNDLGLHKQIVNRVLEPFVMMKLIITGTEWDNFFWLRHHKDADPTIAELAKVMLEVYNTSTPELLKSGEWHTPYVEHSRDASGNLIYIDNGGKELSLDDARIISTSCCAQVSYRKNDDTLDKAVKVFDMLNLIDDSETRRKHSSPCEHPASPIDYDSNTSTDGITHMDVFGNIWSGNLQGWVQYRHTFKNESCKKHPEIIQK